MNVCKTSGREVARRANHRETPSAAARRAFTLVELLVVIGIVAVLLAILLPVFARARAKARESTCTANLHQLGQAILMYASDYDDRFPYGGDPADIDGGDLGYTSGDDTITNFPRLRTVMAPYVGDWLVWLCPSDIGFTKSGYNDYVFDTRPSSYNRFGASYYYLTELAIGQYPVSNLSALTMDAPRQQRGPSDIVVLMDGSGAWHGGDLFETGRFCSLFVDGHVKTLTQTQFSATHDIELQR